MISRKNVLVVLVVVILISIICELSIELVGPRITGNKSELPKREKVLQAVQVVESHGYPFEEHEVSTEDGYILILHRIPRSINARSKDPPKVNTTERPIALIQHGLLAASDTFLFRGPEYDLPYLLADSGYDVWLSNIRGNYYSDRHKEIDSKTDPEFWKFSLHEVGYYDLPAMIDYILETTQKKSLFFIGHSIGSSAAFILGSLRPEYNSKIKLHMALAPLVYNLHEVSIPHKIYLASQELLRRTVVPRNIFNIFPRREYMSKFLETLCADGMPIHYLCFTVMFNFVGADGHQFNKSILPEFLTYYPAGSSIYLASQAVQWYNERTIFRGLDYLNDLENLQKYNSLDPPEYNISLVNHAVSLHYSDGDYIVTEEDLDYLGNKLPNLVGKFKVPLKDFNHMDFMTGVDAKDLLYKELLKIMNKYR